MARRAGRCSIARGLRDAFRELDVNRTRSGGATSAAPPPREIYPDGSIGLPRSWQWHRRLEGAVAYSRMQSSRDGIVGGLLGKRLPGCLKKLPEFMDIIS
jgi:hypothetical protein